MRTAEQQIGFIQNYLTSLFGSDLHVKRVCSLSNAVLGVMTSASLAVAAIGQAPRAFPVHPRLPLLRCDAQQARPQIDRSWSA
jgi:hypothetical protein